MRLYEQPKISFLVSYETVCLCFVLGHFTVARVVARLARVFCCHISTK